MLYLLTPELSRKCGTPTWQLTLDPGPWVSLVTISQELKLLTRMHPEKLGLSNNHLQLPGEG